MDLDLDCICILKHLKATIAPWSDKRLIFVGDEANSYPKGFLTKKELKELRRKKASMEYAHNGEFKGGLPTTQMENKFV